MRYLAIDYGSKRVGLAVCDPDETIASPLCVIEGQKDVVGKIAEVVKQEGVGAVVVGLPLNMDDSAGPQAKLIFRFAEQLERVLAVPIHFQDERLSSFSAEEKLAAAEITKKTRKKHLDAVAAAEILEAFLEQKHTQ
ncbi:MAG: Holliday junction resolvase RuvX [Planctomycetota bacterium]|jgi:putative Holliday junction resolvase